MEAQASDESVEEEDQDAVNYANESYVAQARVGNVVESKEFLKLRENAEHKNSECDIEDEDSYQKAVFVQALFEGLSQVNGKDKDDRMNTVEEILCRDY